ncbi:MAG: WG repeat-containing protein, partial [Prosthecobacter sp.]|nr:WG repeat-containing protein [Prosthecobacter sp.]
MKRLRLILCLTTALHAQQPAAAPHTFTSTDGRKLTATIIEKTATTVTIRRAEDGKDFVLPLDRLSAADQALVKAWGTKPVPLVMADPALPESWVVPPKYQYAWEFARLPGTSGPMYTTFETSGRGDYKNKRAGLIRSDGVVLCDPDKDESVPPDFFVKDGVQASQAIASYFRDHRVFPKLSAGKWGLVDLDGQQVLPPQWDWVGSFSEGLFHFNITGKYGYANLKGEVVIQPLWTYAQRFSGGYAIVQASKGGKQIVIDKTGKIISEAVWDDVKALRVFRGVPIPYHVSIFDHRPAELPSGVFWV